MSVTYRCTCEDCDWERDIEASTEEEAKWGAMGAVDGHTINGHSAEFEVVR